MSFNFLNQLPSPEEIKKEYPLPEKLAQIKKERDAAIRKVLTGEDDRFLVIIGPCSADSEEPVCDYVSRLTKIAEDVKDRLIIIPRVYTNKPRTTGEGYKGIATQPDPEKAPDMVAGLIAMRKLHIRTIEESGLTPADEMLYPENWSYIDDLLSYVAIGARSVEDQQHRFVASGIDVPTGMKNPTSGNLNVMFNGIYAAQNKQNFLFNGEEVETPGNALAHVILRGSTNEYGKNVPNFYYDDVLETIEHYEQMGLENPFIVIDTNHDNSGKNFMEQVRIVREVLLNREWDERIADTVRGFMIESYLEDGRQDTPEVYGKSITDPCLGWAKTDSLIREIHNRLS